MYSKIKHPPSSRVSPTAVPPLHIFEGTHGVRFAWGNADAIDFVAIASSLRATNGRRAVGNTNRLKAVPLRFVRQLRTQTAQSDGTNRQARRSLPRRRCGSCSDCELAHFVYKYALNECSFNRLRTECAPTKQALARNWGLILYPSYFESKEGLRG